MNKTVISFLVVGAAVAIGVYYYVTPRPVIAPEAEMVYEVNGNESNEVILSETLSVMSSQKITTVYGDGRMVVLCSGAPICTEPEKHTYQLSSMQLNEVEDLIAGAGTTPITSDMPDNVMREGTYALKVRTEAGYVTHEATNEQLQSALDILTAAESESAASSK